MLFFIFARREPREKGIYIFVKKNCLMFSSLSVHHALLCSSFWTGTQQLLGKSVTVTMSVFVSPMAVTETFNFIAGFFFPNWLFAIRIVCVAVLPAAMESLERGENSSFKKFGNRSLKDELIYVCAASICKDEIDCSGTIAGAIKVKIDSQPVVVIGNERRRSLGRTSEKSQDISAAIIVSCNAICAFSLYALLRLRCCAKNIQSSASPSA